MMKSLSLPPASAGLGLRRGLIDALLAMPDGTIDFLQCAPDNWIGVGGAHGAALRQLSERIPLSCHGLSLSLGGPDPLDRTLLAQTRAFLDLHNVQLYSEHLSYCAAGGHVYDLLPLPFTAEAVHYVAGRIAQVQDALGRHIAVENISYYAVAGADMSEIDFINAVLAEADCDLLLDVNNVFVNACNNGYDAFEFLARVPPQRVASLHVAGHFDGADGFKIDTHGAPVKQVVWALLHAAYVHVGVRPTLLERDFNFPPLAELLQEVTQIRRAQADAVPQAVAHG
ncbi:MAG: hypothetical protein GAK43_00180 [Stenotrophomonas maltophilia]|nr:MAG: hypothetical protein GAK43_00180 [Stenotrophomonas maltophilia]